MLKKIENNNGVYSLEIEISGVDYNKAISNYIELIPDYLRGFYKDDSFPEGKPPIEVIEKKHYRWEYIASEYEKLCYKVAGK